MEIIIDGETKELSLEELYELIKKDNNKYSLSLSSNKDEDVVSVIFYGTFNPPDDPDEYECMYLTSTGIPFWIRMEIVNTNPLTALDEASPRDNEAVMSTHEIPKECREHL